jgi:DNA adenine methylase
MADFDDNPEPAAALDERGYPIGWVGGKARMRTHILPLVPYTNTYVEPFGGVASVLAARRPSNVEVYNDLDMRLVNLFRCLQDGRTSNRLRLRIESTLYSHREHMEAKRIYKAFNAKPVDQLMKPDVDLAWAFYVLCNQSYGGIFRGPWGRAIGGGRSMAESWWSRVDGLRPWIQRFSSVQIEYGDGIKVIEAYDREETTFYIDPPYCSTKQTNKLYIMDPDEGYYTKLVDALLACKGAVVVSNYDHPILRRLTVAGWAVQTFVVSASSAVKSKNAPTLKGIGNSLERCKRTEVLWRNGRAVELCEGCPDLFAHLPPPAVVDDLFDELETETEEDIF